MQTLSGQLRRSCAFIAGSVAAILLSATAQAAPASVLPSSDEGLRTLSSTRNCDDRNYAAPSLSRIDSGDVNDLAGIAAACLGQVRPGRVDPEDANAAFNAAQLYFTLGLYFDSRDPVRAATYYSSAANAVSASVSALSDNDSSFNSGSRRAQEQNARFKLERTRIQTAAHALLGLADQPGLTRACGTRLECLKSAKSLIDGGNSGANGLSIAMRDGKYALERQKLLVLNARILSALSTLDQNVSLNTALTDLGAVVSALGASSGGMEQALVAEARAALLGTTISEVDALLSDADSAVEVQRAIDYLEQTISMANRSSGSAAATNGLNLKLGGAYLLKASFLASDAADPNDKVQALCNAASAYQKADSAGSPNRLTALTGQGDALAQIHDSGVEDPCNEQTLRGQDSALLAAVDAYDRALSLSEGSGGLQPRSHYVTIASLYFDVGREDEVRPLIEGLQTGAGRDSELSELYVRLAQRRMPDEGATQSEISALCRDELGAILADLTAASAADSTSPLPDLERGHIQYLCGNGIDAESSLVAALAKAEPASKWGQARAKAFHLRSLNGLDRALAMSGSAARSLKREAASWAERSLDFGTPTDGYRVQACRARLASPLELDRLGSEDRYCVAGGDDNDAALLEAMLELRKSKLDYGRTGSLTVFNRAEDAFRSAKTQIVANVASGADAGTFAWPGMNAPLDYAELADYGFLLARACGARRGDSVQTPSDPRGEKLALFQAYNVFYCSYRD